ncbi:MAG: outer membrane beta-barrel protein [Bacteroidetes bacterium]|nr:outer membrane beta-barrel protein [Bacteroidota bacterium]
MKLIFNTLLTLILLLFVSKEAQSQIYIKPYIGYYFPYGGGTYQDNFYKDGINGTQQQKAILQTVSFGSGTGFGFNSGYMFTKNFGIELGIGSVMGNTYKSHSLSQNSSWTNNNSYDVNKELVSNGVINISPSIVLSTNIYKFNPYSKFGLLYSYGGKVLITSNKIYTDDIGKKYKIYEEEEYTHYPDLGFCSAFGCNYNLSDNLKIGLEFYSQNISRYLKHSIFTKSTVDNVDRIGIYKRCQIEVDYSKTQYQINSPFDPNKPSQYRSWVHSYSNYGFNFSLYYTLPKSLFSLKYKEDYKPSIRP